MPAYAYEYELAKQDAIEFWWQTSPVEILAHEGNSHVAAIRCVRMEMTEADATGRRSAQPVPGSEFDIPVDMVVKALGQAKQKEFFSTIQGLELDGAGRVIVDKELMQTGNPKYFAGGDCVNGGREAVDASQMGKLAAQGIHQHLTGERVEFAGARIPILEETQDIKAH
jgi:glutamate synthase (NADPH/NADH) small chain